MEALSEYALRLPPPPLDTVSVQFTSVKRNEKENLALNKKGEKVEKDLKVYLSVDCWIIYSPETAHLKKVIKFQILAILSYAGTHSTYHL